jgi:hypothetical protein
MSQSKGFGMLAAKYAKSEQIFYHEGHEEHEGKILKDGDTARCS